MSLQLASEKSCELCLACGLSRKYTPQSVKRSLNSSMKPPEMDTFKKIYLINTLSIRLIWYVNVTSLHPSLWKERER